MYFRLGEPAVLFSPLEYNSVLAEWLARSTSYVNGREKMDGIGGKLSMSSGICTVYVCVSS